MYVHTHELMHISTYTLRIVRTHSDINLDISIVQIMFRHLIPKAIKFTKSTCLSVTLPI